jgi:hypothetical protein
VRRLGRDQAGQAHHARAKLTHPTLLCNLQIARA